MVEQIQMSQIPTDDPQDALRFCRDLAIFLGNRQPASSDLAINALKEMEISISDAIVAVLGYAYLENSDDIRNSPSAVLVKRLRNLRAEVVIHDPWVPEYQGSLREKIQGCDAVVLMVAHDEYRRLNWAELKSCLRHPVLVDGRHIIADPASQLAGIIYRGLGRSQRNFTVREC